MVWSHPRDNSVGQPYKHRQERKSVVSLKGGRAGGKAINIYMWTKFSVGKGVCVHAIRVHRLPRIKIEIFEIGRNMFRVIILSPVLKCFYLLFVGTLLLELHDYFLEESCSPAIGLANWFKFGEGTRMVWGWMRTGSQTYPSAEWGNPSSF